MNRNRKRAVLAGVGAAVVVVVGLGVWLTLRDNARPVEVDEAKQRTTTTDATDVTEPTSAARPRPAPGVYRYEGTGSESLSTPPLSQSQGPTMPATVELVGEDCWTFRIDYSNNHWQEWDHCWDGEDLVETGGRSWQRWMVGTTAITNTGEFDCDPGTMVLPASPDDGGPWTGRCTGLNDATEGEMVSEGPYRFVGEEPFDVDGTTVTAHRFVRERTMSGAQQGTERSEVWFDAATGLPLRNERRLEARTDTVIGESTYTETGEFQLLSLDVA